MTQFIQARLLPGLISGVSPTRQKVRIALLVAAVTLALVALGPTAVGFHLGRIQAKGLGHRRGD